MELLPHSIDWCKGEIFEARLILLFGVIITLSGILFYATGTTPAAKAMFFPLLITGILFSGTGAGMMYSNPKRITEFTQVAKDNPQAFVASEKTRAEGFIAWYPITRYIFAGLAVLGILFFLFWATPIGRAIGIALIISALGIFVIDHFSEERAGIYYEKILENSK